MMAMGAKSGVGAEGADWASGSSCCSKNSAVILSSELDGTLAAAMPSSLALTRTNLLSRLSFLAIS
jgi:hypothetical protein